MSKYDTTIKKQEEFHIKAAGETNSVPRKDGVSMHPTNRQKRKHYYIAYMLDIGTGVYVGLETHITTGVMCMLTTVVNDDCEGQQHVTRAHAAKLLRAYRKSQVHRIRKVRGKAWIR